MRLASRQLTDSVPNNPCKLTDPQTPGEGNLRPDGRKLAEQLVKLIHLMQGDPKVNRLHRPLSQNEYGYHTRKRLSLAKLWQSADPSRVTRIWHSSLWLIRWPSLCHHLRLTTFACDLVSGRFGDQGVSQLLTRRPKTVAIDFGPVQIKNTNLLTPFLPPPIIIY